MDNFKKLLDKQIMKAKSAIAPAEGAAAENAAEAENTAEDKANISIRKAGQANTPVAKTAEYAGKQPPDGTQSKKPTPVGKINPGWNVNRITVNLFEADSRALAVIKERLSTAGYDFTNRSDSIKIGLRLAVKATPGELAKILEQVKSEDRRFKADDD